ncbi:MAG: hypothetical protein FD149_2475 [Rhodospirillaceae bacterium]|nr:MAG: hypothetical protein FD149_2475 [Rhodospirillaceae bacterium]
MQKWTLRTSVGLFWIAPDRDHRYTLGLDDETLGNYHSPGKAGDDVFLHATGHSPWDESSFSAPEDISEWLKA